MTHNVVYPEKKGKNKNNTYPQLHVKNAKKLQKYVSLVYITFAESIYRYLKHGNSRSGLVNKQTNKKFWNILPREKAVEVTKDYWSPWAGDLWGPSGCKAARTSRGGACRAVSMVLSVPSYLQRCRCALLSGHPYPPAHQPALSKCTFLLFFLWRFFSASYLISSEPIMCY